MTAVVELLVGLWCFVVPAVVALNGYPWIGGMALVIETLLFLFHPGGLNLGPDIAWWWRSRHP